MKASHSKKISKHRPVKVKLEKTDHSSTQPPCPEEKDLTCFVKDRVELMRQIFTTLKNRELLAMAPDCLRSLKVDELQEALLDEVLGISSKRLRSILDGYECQSNTDSSGDSSNEPLETISLDSISSDEDDILSHQDHNKSKKKHLKKKSKAEKLAKKKGKSIGDVSNKNSVKGKKNKKSDAPDAANQKGDDVSGTGMTVLELLELQARARAIRAQLAAVEVKDSNEDNKSNNSSGDSSESDEDEVVIKEEPPEIVEIASSSEDNDDHNSDHQNENSDGDRRKSDATVQSQSKPAQPVKNSAIETSGESSAKANSNVSPQGNQNAPPRKIKLNRTNLLVSVTKASKTVTSTSTTISTSIESVGSNVQSKNSSHKSDKTKNKAVLSKSDSGNMINANSSNSKNLRNENSSIVQNKVKGSENNKIDQGDRELLEKIKNGNPIKVNKVIKKKPIIRERKESEEDEITLELSDTEKMDLLDGFHSPKSFIVEDAEVDEGVEKEKIDRSTDSVNENYESLDEGNADKECNLEISLEDVELQKEMQGEQSNIVSDYSIEKNCDKIEEDDSVTLDKDNMSNISSRPKRSKKKVRSKASQKVRKVQNESNDNVELSKDSEEPEKTHNMTEANEDNESKIENDPIEHLECDALPEDNDVNLEEDKSEGECSYSSDGIEIAEESHEILCISDEEISENSNDGTNRQYRKRKNDASTDDEATVSKTKNQNVEDNNAIAENQIMPILDKEQDEIVNSDNITILNTNGTESVDENSIKDSTEIEVENKPPEVNINLSDNNEKADDDDCVFEISDDSEDETSNVLSKEPTREEIEELSRKIDFEIERENVDILGESNIDLKIRNNENDCPKETTTTTDEGVSWKSRWLKSGKVQRVLATSNLCNALRKKNIELKKKLENDQLKSSIENNQAKEEEEQQQLPAVIENVTVEEKHDEEIEGSISQYEKLTGSTKYVDPVVEPKVDEKAMVTDAKLLMKMYKKLLKMHSLDDNVEIERKKAKKNKKDKKKEKKEKKKNKLKEAESSVKAADVGGTCQQETISESSKS